MTTHRTDKLKELESEVNLHQKIKAICDLVPEIPTLQPADVPPSKRPRSSAASLYGKIKPPEKFEPASFAPSAQWNATFDLLSDGMKRAMEAEVDDRKVLIRPEMFRTVVTSNVYRRSGKKQDRFKSDSKDKQKVLIRPEMCRTVVTSNVYRRSGKKQDRFKSDSEDKQEVQVDPQLTEAAHNVASSLTGDSKKTESDLLSQLRVHAGASNAQKSREAASPSAPSMGDLFAGMRIEKDTNETHDRSRPGRSRDTFERGSILGNMASSRKRLFDGPGLGIFTKALEQEEKQVEASKPDSLWDVVHRDELKQFLNVPPSNSFEEMIKWTKEGKLWHFPINNEQGMEEEAKVGFFEHVLFDELLKEFPSKGPIRHFMELVTTGLSKNPYMTAQEKKEHVLWFKEYFKDKQHILDEVLETAK